MNRRLLTVLATVCLAAPVAGAQTATVDAPPEIAQQADNGAARGQWVHTDQYGWVWMPYGENDVYTPPTGHPYMFVYYPAYGWRWVVAPWVWGSGPSVYFGPIGPRRYVWFGARHRYYRPWHYHRIVPYRAFGPRRGWHRW